MVEMLEAGGFAVTAVGDGLAALQALRHRRFDAVVTDLDMPRLDGRALIRRLGGLRPDLPILVVSGAVPEDGGAALAAATPALVAVLAKPVMDGALLAALRFLLAGGPPTGFRTAAGRACETLAAAGVAPAT
jgi:CheY-like chemotaxis protein